MIVNPYAVGQGMNLDKDLWSITYGLLRHLVWAAAVKNLEGLKEAKKKLIETDFKTDMMISFNRLPDNVATREAIRETDKLLHDKKQQDIIVTNWIDFFRKQYQEIARQE